MRSIKLKLIMVTLILVIVPFAVSNFLSNYYITRDYMENSEENSMVLAGSIADYVMLFVEKAYSVTEEIINNSDILSFQPERQAPVLVNCSANNPYFDLLYIQGMDGIQTARSKGELGDRSNRWWFLQMIEDKQPFVSKSYYSLTGNVAVTSVFIPIYDSSSNMLGIMGADIKLDVLQNIVEKFSNSKGFYAYIIDGEGVVIAHPDSKQVEELYNYRTLKKTVLVKDKNGEITKDEKGNQITELQDIKVTEKLREITEAA